MPGKHNPSVTSHMRGILTLPFYVGNPLKKKKRLPLVLSIAVILWWDAPKPLPSSVAVRIVNRYGLVQTIGLHAHLEQAKTKPLMRDWLLVSGVHGCRLD